MKMRNAILVSLLIGLMSCASPPPIPNYESLSASVSEESSLIIGSAIDVSLPVADIFVVVKKIDGEEIDSSTSKGHVYTQKPVVVVPGVHKIEIHVNQVARTGVHVFTLDMEKGKTYIAIFEPENYEFGHVWIKEYGSGVIVTEKVRIERPLVRGLIIIT